MAFRVGSLSVLAYANGFSLWHYKAVEQEVLRDVTNRDFFTEAAGLFSFGDVLMISAMDGARLLAVSAADGRFSVSVLS